MTAYYNENDRQAAATLRELIKRNHIAQGDVDERSIEDVTPGDLAGYKQCHFFAGCGVWSYSLRLAGWPDARPVWTGSCPCQPFSAAGKGGGFADERHLWPAWFHLILNTKPRGVPLFGEQVASRDGLAWLDVVHSDLEGAGHAVRAFDLCAAGFGAPHIRQRLYFVADAQRGWRRQPGGTDAAQGTLPSPQRAESAFGAGSGGGDGGLAHHHHQRLEGWNGVSERGEEFLAGAGSVAGGMDNGIGNGNGRGKVGDDYGKHDGQQSYAAKHFIGVDYPERERELRNSGDGARASIAAQGGRTKNTGIDEAWDASATMWPCPVNGFWKDADWLYCRDGKWRPVRPGSFPLAHGVAARVGRLRLYGNAIVATQAAEFIKAYEDVRTGRDLI